MVSGLLLAFQSGASECEIFLNSLPGVRGGCSGEAPFQLLELAIGWVFFLKDHALLPDSDVPLKYRSPCQSARSWTGGGGARAHWLAKEMSEAVGETVKVRPVVALPGWYVPNPNKKWGVWVLSGKMVPSWIEQEPSRLSEQLIGRVAYQLDRRCRMWRYEGKS